MTDARSANTDHMCKMPQADMLEMVAHLAVQDVFFENCGLEFPNYQVLFNRMNAEDLCGEDTEVSAFLAEGSDQFEEDDVMYIPQLKAVAGLLLRERVAANFFIGWYAHAALVVIESAARAGAINVSGASELSQVPFLVGCSDYCLIGEEVFAAGAYITKDPVQTSTIAGQDYIKFIIIASMIIGTILTMAGYPQLLKFLG